jgi:hypothetical protein
MFDHVQLHAHPLHALEVCFSQLVDAAPHVFENKEQRDWCGSRMWYLCRRLVVYLRVFCLMQGAMEAAVSCL